MVVPQGTNRRWRIKCALSPEEGLAPREARLERVPEGDLLLAALPAQVDEFAVHVRVEVDQPAVRGLQAATEAGQPDRCLVHRLELRRQFRLELRVPRVLVVRGVLDRLAP